MKPLIRNATILLMLFLSFRSYPGNPDRVGQAGATELLINPWARSSGWDGCNTAEISGVEALNFNPSGIVSVPNTEILYSRTNYLSGTDIFINSFGLVQKIGKEKTDAIGLSIISFDFGDIPVTTTDQPEGGLGTFSPQYTNIALSYAHKFSNRIRSGITVRAINESIPQASASGVSLDAGLQYISDVTGKDEDKTKFSVSLRNVGTPMRFGGDGLTQTGTFSGSDVSLSVDSRSAEFELPTLLNIGLAEDFYFDTKHYHKLTIAGTFVSNSFTNDQYNIGLQYSLRNIIMLRGGMIFEKNIFDNQNRQDVFTGPAAGFSINIPFGKDRDKSFGVDYSYRATQYFAGTHCFGARIVL